LKNIEKSLKNTFKNHKNATKIIVLTGTFLLAYIMMVVHHIRTTPGAFRINFIIIYYDLSLIFNDF